MKIFVSYNRADQQAVEKLIAELRRDGHAIWSDTLLYGGQQWWSEILDQIEQSDAVVLALSPEFLESDPCAQEWQYAARLGKHLLPIAVAPVMTRILPGVLAGIHVAGSVAELGDALYRLPPARPLPDPRPARPAPPLFVYALMRDKICAGPLDIAEQFAIVAELILLSRSAEAAEPDVARRLLNDVGRSRYLYAGPARLLHELDRPEPVAVTSTPWRVVIGSALGAIGITSLLILVGAYRILPRPFELVVPNAALAVVGVFLCLSERRRHPRAARLGLAVCVLGIIASGIDLLNAMRII